MKNSEFGKTPEFREQVTALISDCSKRDSSYGDSSISDGSNSYGSNSVSSDGSNSDIFKKTSQELRKAALRVVGCQGVEV